VSPPGQWFRSGARSLGFTSKAATGWALYDWANNAFVTTVLAVIMPIFYTDVVAADAANPSGYWAFTLTASYAIVAVLSPLIGSIADQLGAAKRALFVSTSIGVIFTGALVLVGQGDWLLASGLFIVANVAFGASMLFYNSLLPHVVEDDSMDTLSTAGFALGYFGGGILLLVNLAWIRQPELFGLASETMATRLSLFSAALWWAVFSIPLFTLVDERPPTSDDPPSTLGRALDRATGQLRRTAANVGSYRQAMLFLIAFWFYNNGISAIIGLSAAYGSDIGFEQTTIITTFVLVQFVGIPFAFLFGYLARSVDTKRLILGGLLMYVVITIGSTQITERWHFLALGLAVATVQGGTQALSRSLFASLVPKCQSSEFFSFYNLTVKTVSILGTFLYGVVVTLTGRPRYAVASIAVFFLIGIALLTRVDVEAGRQQATAPSTEESSGRPPSLGVDEATTK
jgi:UMF1 family MFS transporter